MNIGMKMSMLNLTEIGKMKIEVNKEQLEILKYAILWYECNDKEEERIVNELEEKLYNAQEQDLLRSFTNMGGLQ